MGGFGGWGFQKTVKLTKCPGFKKKTKRSHLLLRLWPSRRETFASSTWAHRGHRETFPLLLRFKSLSPGKYKWTSTVIKSPLSLLCVIKTWLNPSYDNPWKNKQQAFARVHTATGCYSEHITLTTHNVPLRGRKCYFGKKFNLAFLECNRDFFFFYSCILHWWFICPQNCICRFVSSASLTTFCN